MSGRTKNIVSRPFYQLLGVVVALSILLISGVPTYQDVDSHDVQTEQTSEDDAPEGLTFSFNEAVTSSIQFSVSFQSFLIVALPDFLEVNIEGRPDSGLSEVNPKKILVLFRLIISPNAP